MKTPPVLFLLFNRPDLAEQVFARIREARPSQLFVAVDGPRAHRQGEAEKCAACHKIVEKVDWACEVHTLFRKQNLGCRKAVSEAITWFFEHVEEGIVLEDDCVADASFFPFCEELLARYRDDERIMAISGDNFQPDGLDCGASYYFSKYPHCWGWATWRRAWDCYDDEMRSWKSFSTSKQFRELFYSYSELSYWQRHFDAVLKKRIDTWDHVWTYSCWLNQGITILPCKNTVCNIGFGQQATHTSIVKAVQLPEARALEFPLTHPRKVAVQRKAEIFTDQNLYSGSQPTFLFSLETLLWIDRKRHGKKLLNVIKNLLLFRHWRVQRLLFMLKSVIGLSYVKFSYFRALFYGIRAKEYFLFGRKIGWAVRKECGFSEALPYLLGPVRSIRFFEFDFTKRWLPSDWDTAFDASSTVLLSLFQANQTPMRTITYANPDPREKLEIEKISRILNMENVLRVLTKGVEEFDDHEICYDVVWSISVIEHIKNDRIDDIKAVKILYRLVKPGGRLIITVPSDKCFREEYRDEDVYGTQKSKMKSGKYFFERYYDEEAIQNRIIDSVGISPMVIEWYGEKQNDRFKTYLGKWISGESWYAFNDPYEFSRHYKLYETWAEMPGFGVCALVFEKPLRVLR